MGAFNPRSPDTAAAICAARSDTVKEVINIFLEENVKDIKKKIVYCFVEKKNWLEFRNMVWG